jgi:hypothetical protein
MSEESFEKDQQVEETDDVEAHKKATMAANDEGGNDDSDDVEAHQRRAQQHKSN